MEYTKTKETKTPKMIEKAQFVKELIGLTAKRTNKIYNRDEVKKINTLSYKEIIQEFDNIFNKLTTGIYCAKLENGNIVGCLLDKTIEDFYKLYNKTNKNTSQTIQSQESSNNINNTKIRHFKLAKNPSWWPKGGQIKVNKQQFKKAIKATTIALAVSMVGMTSVACYTTPETKTNINQIDPNYQEKINIGDKRNYNEQTTNIQITPEEAAKGKTVENTKRTVNEYGNTIYGKPISEQEVLSRGLNSEIGIKNDKKRGRAVTYTEYYSDAYGGKVYIATVDKSGGIQIFNENGKEFIAGKKPQNDLEVILANYRMGNAMADAIKKTYK